MTTADYKIKLLGATLVAARRETVRGIAQAVGIPQSTLSTFVNGGPLGAKKCGILEDWLKDKGYWDLSAALEPATLPDMAREVGVVMELNVCKAYAQDFEAKAALLRSEMPARQKWLTVMRWLETTTEVWQSLEDKMEGERE